MCPRVKAYRNLAAIVLAPLALAWVAPAPALATTDCGITAPASITKANDVNQAGAVVNYNAPTTTGTCSTVTCSPASGSFYPLGTTLVTCTASTTPAVKASLTITVNDTQPPHVTAPANQAANNDPGKASATVALPDPTATDNAP